MLKILSADEAMGPAFKVPSGGAAQIIMVGHAGGTWMVELEAEDGTWVDGGLKISASGAYLIEANPSSSYRMNGGDEGAAAWVVMSYLTAKNPYLV